MKINKLRHLMASFVREDTLDGKDYYVIPSIAITEGVHNGVLYTNEELAKIPNSWNGVPVTNGHPEKDGMPNEASTPEMLEEFKIGLWLNCKFEDGKLKGEIWLDKEKCENINPDIIANLQNNTPTDVSTGLFTDDDIEDGEWNGEKYNRIAKNYRPDHLAILPNDVGACSWDDGAGMARLNKQLPKTNKKDKKTNFHFNAELSNDEIRTKLYDLLEKSSDAYYWITDVYQTYFVYEEEANNTKLFKQSFVLDNQGNVTLVDNKIEVERVTEYKVVTNKESNMERKEMVEKLVANETSQWVQEDVEFLTNLSDEQFEKVAKFNEIEVEVEKVVEVEKEVKVDEEVKINSVDEFIAQAPAEMKEVLESSLKMHNSKKDAIVAKLIENKANLFSKEELNVKTLEELVKLEKLAHVDADYSLQAPQAEVKTNSEVDAPEMPSIDWEN